MKSLLDPMVAYIVALLLPALTFSLVLVGTAAVAIYSRSPQRRVAACKVLRIIVGMICSRDS